MQPLPGPRPMLRFCEALQRQHHTGRVADTIENDRKGGFDMTMIATMRRAAILGGVALAALGLSSTAFAQRTKLTVYTAIENEQLDPFKKAFEADNPNIEIAWVRDSTGVMTAKLIAEKDNPRADVVWGLAASSIGLMGSLGMIEPYTPANAARAEADVQERQEPRDLGRHGRLPRRRVLQHRRGGEEQEAQAHQLGRPHQARVQGFDRDAEPGLVGHRLSDGGRLAHHHGRGRGLEVHGRAAPERVAVPPFRLGALRAGRQGRAR